MDRAQATVVKYGKTVIGWHQLVGANPAEGALAQYWGLTVRATPRRRGWRRPRGTAPG